MKQRSPRLENLTPELLKEQVADLLNIGIRERAAIELSLAQSIIINTLGDEFWAKECTSFGNKQEFFAQKPDVRVVHLAHVLWCLKDGLGFREFLEKNNKNDFESTYYEAVAAYMFLKESRSIELVIPSQVRGKDFDIRVVGFKSQEILNVEVKARRKIFRSERQALNFLKSCRSQLPKDQKGAIFCKIAIGEGTIGQNQVISATQEFLAGTNRINFVVYCWDSSPTDNAIALAYCAVDLNGYMRPILGSAFQPVVPEFMNAATRAQERGDLIV